MADEPTAAATATAPRPVTGFVPDPAGPEGTVNGTVPAPAPDGAPANEPTGRTTAQSATTPAWPDAAALATADDRWQVRQFDAALQVLQDVLVTQATGVRLDPDDRARHELDQLNGAQTGLALRVLAAQARAYALSPTPLGQALTAAGFPDAAAFLDIVADRMAEMAPFDLPDLVTDGVADPAIAATFGTATLARTRAAVDTVFESLDVPSVNALRTPVFPPDGAVAGEPFPVLIPRQDLRGPGRLLTRLEAFSQRLDGRQDSAPGATMALLVAEEALGGNRTAQESASYLATLTVGSAPSPLDAAAQLRQLAGYLDQSTTEAGLQSDTLGTYGHGQTLPQYLDQVAAAIEVICADPARVIEARAASLLGRPAAAVRAVEVKEAEPPVVDGAEAATETTRAPISAGATPHTDNPVLLPEAALLGSLIYAPAVMADLDFLAPRDFTRSENRAVFATLRALHERGELFDVAAMPTQAQQLQAANENLRRVHTALRAHLSTAETVSNIPRLLGVLTRAAPPESIPFRGVFEPGAQIRLGRMVLEDSVRRQLHGVGVRMEAAKALVNPLQGVTNRAERSAEALVTNLETIDAQLKSMTERMVAAVTRTGAAPADSPAAQQAARAGAGRWHLPERLMQITRPRLMRSEKHILHLALHAGTLDGVPENILSLRPEDFSAPRHANTWRAIQLLREQGLPVNYVAVHWATHLHRQAGQPVLSEGELLPMAQPPEIKPEKVARSLRTLVSASLSRARTAGRAAVAQVAADRAVPVTTALQRTQGEVGRLSAVARTALQRHQETTVYQQRTGSAARG